MIIEDLFSKKQAFVKVYPFFFNTFKKFFFLFSLTEFTQFSIFTA